MTNKENQYCFNFIQSFILLMLILIILQYHDLHIDAMHVHSLLLKYREPGVLLVIHWSIRLEPLSPKALLPLWVPSHVLAKLVIVPNMQCCHTRSPVVLAIRIALLVFIPLCYVFLHHLYARQPEFSIKEFCQPPTPYFRCVQISQAF